jgi:hypothetical protein
MTTADNTAFNNQRDLTVHPRVRWLRGTGGIIVQVEYQSIFLAIKRS